MSEAEIRLIERLARRLDVAQKEILPEFSEAGWQELNKKLSDAEAVTWRELEQFVAALRRIAAEARVTAQ